MDNNNLENNNITPADTNVTETPIESTPTVEPVAAPPVETAPAESIPMETAAPLAEITPEMVQTPPTDEPSIEATIVSEEKAETEKKPNILIIVVIVLVFLLGSLGGVFAFMNKTVKDERNNQNTTKEITKVAKTEEMITEEVEITAEAEKTTEASIPAPTTAASSNKRKPTPKDQQTMKAIIDADFPLTSKDNTEYQINGSLTEQQLYDNFVASWKAYDSSSFKWGDSAYDYSVINLKADVLDCTDKEYDTELFKSNTTGKIDKIRVVGNGEEYTIIIK